MNGVRDVRMRFENVLDGGCGRYVQWDERGAAQFFFYRVINLGITDDNGNLPLQQIANNAPADEASAACDKKFHDAKISGVILFAQGKCITKIESIAKYVCGKIHNSIGKI